MKLKVFFSWQTETNPQGFNNKQFLINCINSALKQIENKGDLEGITFEFHEGLRGISGNASVAAEMFRLIDESDIFIGDMTVAQHLNERAEALKENHELFMRYAPNCNVYGEYNRALGKHDLFWKQIVLLMNEANKSVYDDPDVIPFDTRDRRWPIYFTLKDDNEESKRHAKDELLKTLPDAIRLCALEARKYISNRYYPFVTWFTHSKQGGLNSSSVSEKMADMCKANIYSQEGAACIIGGPGTDKTVLVQKACRESILANNYLYVNLVDYEYQEFKKTLETIFKDVKDAIVVIDNCCEDVLERVLSVRRRERASNKVVALFEKPLEGAVNLSTYKFFQSDMRDLFGVDMKECLDVMRVTNPDVQERVTNFSEGNIGLVQSIGSSLSSIADVRMLTSEFLTSKVLESTPNDIERVIMQSLSLFEFIGWKEDRAGELEFILNDKNITPIDVEKTILTNKAIALIKKGLKRGLFIERGRTVSVTPRPMALQLISEWLESVDEKRLLAVITSINGSPHGKRLLHEFHDRFRFMGESEEASSMIAAILRPGCVFEKFDVINTDEGAMLLDSFAEVNPQAVVQMLQRIINTKSQEQLLALVDGRRYIVWTLDKLCFRSDTFKQSAALMLRLANAENEHISNNATGQFIGLFPVMLPATETNLTVRLEFLKEQFKLNQNRTVLMSALKRALTNRDFILFSGAETMGDKKLEPYTPKSYAEIASYFEGCLDILVCEISKHAEYEPKAVEILEDTVIPLCDGGYASLVLPVIDNIAKQRNYDWGKMQHTLSFFYGKVKGSMNPEDRDLYEEIVRQLTKMDPVSRFLRAEKESFYTEEGLRESYEKRIEKNKETFEVLANDFYDKQLIDKETLCKLICSENISTYPFGSTLAKRMTLEEQYSFVHNMIDAINECEKPSIDILCQFISEVDNETFDNLIPELKKSKFTYTLFACIGIRNIKPGEDLFTHLHELVEKGNASVEDYHQYWTRLKIGQMTEDDCIRLFDEILTFNGGFAIVLKMSFFLLMDKKIIGFRKLADFMANAFLNYKEGPVIDLNLALNNAEALLRAYDYPELAHRINDEILGYAKASHTSFSHSYELEVIYRLLMSKYFNVIWPSLSHQLLADGDEFMAYYNMKWFLGVGLVDNDNPIINEGNHFDEMKPWLEAHPEIAPMRLASLILVADEQGEFTPEAMYLIDNYGKDRNVLSELGCSLNSFASVGSVLPQYEHRRNIYSKLLNHRFEEVRIWAQSEVNSCEYMIAYEGKREQEKM